MKNEYDVTWVTEVIVEDTAILKISNTFLLGLEIGVPGASAVA